MVSSVEMGGSTRLGLHGPPPRAAASRQPRNAPEMPQNCPRTDQQALNDGFFFIMIHSSSSQFFCLISDIAHQHHSTSFNQYFIQVTILAHGNSPFFLTLGNRSDDLVGGDWNHGILTDFPFSWGHGISSQLVRSRHDFSSRGRRNTINQIKYLTIY